jgi:opacity protein-like surface antigen
LVEPCSTRYVACYSFDVKESFAMKRVFKTLIIASAAAGVLAPLQARADGFVTPWVGSAFGSNINNGQTSIGVSAGGMGAGIIGGEADFGWSPSFFGTKSDFGNNTVMDLMGNLIIGVPIGGQHGAGVRPYVVGGVGLLRTQIDGGTVAKVSSSDNMFAWDAGAGLMGFFSDHVGLRGDVRYLRGVSDFTTNVSSIDVNGDKLHFWRASIGVTFR